MSTKTPIEAVVDSLYIIRRKINVTPIRNSDWRSEDEFQATTPAFVTNNRKMRKKNDS